MERGMRGVEGEDVRERYTFRADMGEGWDEER
jgi:hypothetical protein